MFIVKPVFTVLLLTTLWLFQAGPGVAETTGPIDIQNSKLHTTKGPISLNELKGQVVYVDFWASWCVPCRKSFPWMNQMQTRYGPLGFKIIAVNVDSEPELARQFLAEYPAKFTIAFDPDGKAATAFKVKGMPNSFLIGRDGRLHSSHVGFREKEITTMEADIKNLVNR